jgi:hypothetical protein
MTKPSDDPELAPRAFADALKVKYAPSPSRVVTSCRDCPFHFEDWGNNCGECEDMCGAANEAMGEYHLVDETVPSLCPLPLTVERRR